MMYEKLYGSVRDDTLSRSIADRAIIAYLGCILCLVLSGLAALPWLL